MTLLVASGWEFADGFAKLSLPGSIPPPDAPMMIPYLLGELFGFFAGLGLIGVLLALVTSIFWTWMIIHAATNPSLDGTQKIVWLLVILFLHFLGALIYFIVGRGSQRAGV